MLPVWNMDIEQYLDPQCKFLGFMFVIIWLNARFASISWIERKLTTGRGK